MACIADAASEIPGFEGLYAVTTNGVVYSLPRKQRKKLKVMTPIDNTLEGYLRVRLSRDGKSALYYIHRLVAETYIPNPEKKPMVNHIDGNKANNRKENLEWVTGQENRDHAFHLGLYPAQKIASSQKLEVYELVQQGMDVAEVAQRYGMQPGGVRSLVRRYKEAQELQMAA